jgi:hypothetical protein
MLGSMKYIITTKAVTKTRYDLSAPLCFSNLLKIAMDGRVFLYLIMTFGWKLVVLHTTPAIFSKFSVHSWRYYGGLNEGYSISVHQGSNSFGIPKGPKVSLALNELI